GRSDARSFAALGMTRGGAGCWRVDQANSSTFIRSTHGAYRLTVAAIREEHRVARVPHPAQGSAFVAADRGCLGVHPGRYEPLSAYWQRDRCILRCTLSVRSELSSCLFGG